MQTKPDFYLIYHIGVKGGELKTFYTIEQAREVYNMLIDAVGPENVTMTFEKLPESFQEFLSAA